jgi:hypothetical protein
MIVTTATKSQSRPREVVENKMENSSTSRVVRQGNWFVCSDLFAHVRYVSPSPSIIAEASTMP